MVWIEVLDCGVWLQQLEAVYPDDTCTEGENEPGKTREEEDPVIKKRKTL